MNTQHTIQEVELALAKSKYFNFTRNIVAFNVQGLNRSLRIWHECDMLVLSNAGYLTEIAICLDWNDFLRSLKKEEAGSAVKCFYYCIPEGLLEMAYNKLEELAVDYTGIVTFDESLRIELHGHRTSYQGEYTFPYIERPTHRKLFLEEQLQIARLGAMKVVGLKEKCVNIRN